MQVKHHTVKGNDICVNQDAKFFKTQNYKKCTYAT